MNADDAAIASAQTQLSYTSITAPISGKMGFRSLDPARFALHAFHIGSDEDQETEFAKSRSAHYERGPKELRQWVEAITAQEPPLEVLAIVQLAHGSTFGLTQVGTMGLLVQNAPPHMMARAQGYLTACTGIVTSLASVLSGAIYAQHGQGVYYLMAAMALVSAFVMWLARHRLRHYPQSDASGG